MRRRADVRHTGDADEFLEVLGHELRAVVGNDAWLNVRVSLFAACKMISGGAPQRVDMPNQRRASAPGEQI